MTVRIGLLIILIISLIITACGQSSEKPAENKPVQFLAERFENLNLSRSSEPKTFVGEDLFEHINGGAEIYHLYDFEEVCTAYYMYDTAEILIDIYRFANSDKAYGLFTTLRPLEPDIEKIGVEAIISEGNIEFVKGPYLVRLIAYDVSADMAALLKRTAMEFENKIPGNTEMPSMFSLFPSRGLIAHTEKIFASSYLGWQALSDVYTKNYTIGDDTVTLFLAKDEAGEKFMKWADKVRAEGASNLSGIEIPYDVDYGIKFEHAYYSTIIGGLKSGYLAGIVGYSDKCRDFLVNWLNLL
jgi:hypothetical protein